MYQQEKAWNNFFFGIFKYIGPELIFLFQLKINVALSMDLDLACDHAVWKSLLVKSTTVFTKMLEVKCLEEILVNIIIVLKLQKRLITFFQVAIFYILIDNTIMIWCYSKYIDKNLIILFLVKESSLGSLGNGLDNRFEEPAIDRTFNETCCKEKGVTYECMANCKDARGPVYEGFRMGMPESRCTKFKYIIENCIVSG